MKAVDHLTELIIKSFNKSLDQKALLIKAEFSIEIHRIATMAYNAGIGDGAEKESARIKEFSEQFTPPGDHVKTKQGMHGTLYSVDGMIWFSTPEAAQASYDKRAAK